MNAGCEAAKTVSGNRQARNGDRRSDNAARSIAINRSAPVEDRVLDSCVIRLDIDPRQLSGDRRAFCDLHAIDQHALVQNMNAASKNRFSATGTARLNACIRTTNRQRLVDGEVLGVGPGSDNDPIAVGRRIDRRLDGRETANQNVVVVEQPDCAKDVGDWNCLVHELQEFDVLNCIRAVGGAATIVHDREVADRASGRVVGKVTSVDRCIGTRATFKGVIPCTASKGIITHTASKGIIAAVAL